MPWLEVKSEHLVSTLRSLRKHPPNTFPSSSPALDFGFPPAAHRLGLSYFYIQAFAHDMSYSQNPLPLSSPLI